MATPRPQEAQSGQNAISNIFCLSPGLCPPITAPMVRLGSLPGSFFGLEALVMARLGPRARMAGSRRRVPTTQGVRSDGPPQRIRGALSARSHIL